MSKLPKAPLQEVIFEIRWETDINPETNRQFDKDFELALGVFKSLVVKDFPFRKKILELPAEYALYRVTNQFWTAENTWPVIQMGPGVLTVNEVDKGYDWQNNYYDLIKTTLETLEKAYGNKINYNFTSLRYIDSVKIGDYGFDKVEDFLNSSLNFKFENSFDTLGPLQDLQFDQVFQLVDGSGLHLAFSNGKDENKNKLFLWQTAVNRQGVYLKDEVINWCDNAHTTSSKIFKEITKKDFYERFTTS